MVFLIGSRHSLGCVSGGIIRKFEWIFRQFKEEIRRLSSAKSRIDDAEMAERRPKLRIKEFLRHTLGCVSSGTIRKFEWIYLFETHSKAENKQVWSSSCVSVDWQWNISHKQRTITDISFATPIRSTQRLCIASIRTNSLCIRETQNRVTALGVSRLPCEAKQYLGTQGQPRRTLHHQGAGAHQEKSGGQAAKAPRRRPQGRRCDL